MNERTIKKRNTEATSVVRAVNIEQDHGLRSREDRSRELSGEASMGSRWEANGIRKDVEEDFVSDDAAAMVDVDEDEGVLHRPEFRERGVEAPLSRRRSKLVPLFAICERDFSAVSKALLFGTCADDSVGVREIRGESSASSSTGEPDERLGIGGGGDFRTHPARRNRSKLSGAEKAELSLRPWVGWVYRDSGKG